MLVLHTAEQDNSPAAFNAARDAQALHYRRWNTNSSNQQFDLHVTLA